MATYYVGWDVGAWHCSDKASPKSHDAIIIFDEKFNFISCGCGNIKKSLENSENITDFLCNFVGFPQRVNLKKARFIIAIDAVLGWPDAFLKLLTDTDISRKELKALMPCEKSIDNKFLFRDTEREVANRRTPLSAVNDKIGSQSTKAVYFLKYFGFIQNNVIWKNGNNIAIETYPSAAAIATTNLSIDEIKKQLSKYKLKYRRKEIKKNLLFESESLNTEYVTAIDVDLQDAIICAWVAKSYAEKKCKEPLESLKGNEGWIWLPEKAEK